MAKSNSSGQVLPLHLKLKEAWRQSVMLMRSRNPLRARDFSSFDAVAAEYVDAAQTHGGFDLKDTRLFEIGCGQRPYRMYFLTALGYDVHAVDMDKVLISLNPRDVIEIFRRNGFERALKTVARYLVFDRAENRALRKELSRIQDRAFDWPVERIRIGNAADTTSWPDGTFGFVYSEDVFEHVPRDELDPLCEVLAEKLDSTGIAFIRPMVFTGLQGGHNVEWYDADSQKTRECPPWDHLRDRRFPANTFLNELTLAEYRDLFARHFDILEERPKKPGLGEAFMTPELRAELAQWSDEELYSNQVLFVLRRKSS